MGFVRCMVCPAHKPLRTANHDGSAGMMEVEANKVLCGAQTIGLLQSYYKKVVASKCNSVAELRRKLLRTLKHSCSTDKKPQHEDCPLGKDSWWFFFPEDHRLQQSPSTPSREELLLSGPFCGRGSL
ncbi:aminopeptidase n [Plakobranchus ocellatus]|uniref:Aminopeptidase n n=1 Tax=Plakobranchus ocellatus TaxID=259542 RepID=A0AAV3XQK9_9GAST|nr:aminopeptidase n [Plakobranchus ocellatus]